MTEPRSHLVWDLPVEPPWPELRKSQEGFWLARGSGLSYGDCSLNGGHQLLLNSKRTALVHFDDTAGEATFLAGASLKKIVALTRLRGWSVPVLPGNWNASLGGSIGNDVHGKNHFSTGPFCHHVKSLRLLRSDGRVLNCSRNENSEIFYATLGGLGLTGLILDATLKLKTGVVSHITFEDIAAHQPSEILAELKESSLKMDETHAWYFPHLNSGFVRRAEVHRKTVHDSVSKHSEWTLPKMSQIFRLGRRTISLAARFQCLKAERKCGRRRVANYASQFPLQSISNWNLLFGPQGLVQYQFVAPTDCVEAVLNEILSLLNRFGHFSPWISLKVFGSIASEGLLSFPRPGVTVAINILNEARHRSQLLRTLDLCDRVLIDSGGALYPAKDSRMNQKMFAHSFPKLQDFLRLRDPGFSSDFFRRVVAL